MVNKENKKRINQEWYERVRNTPQHKEQKRNWYLANRDEILRKKKERNALKPPRILLTKEEKRAKRKEWEVANRLKINLDSTRRRKENLVKYQLYARGYYRENLSFKAQFGRLMLSTKERNLDLTLSLEEFTKIVSKVCDYCGEVKERRGIDRIDNTKGYTKENSASCCKICNYMKRTMSVSDFLSHINKIYQLHKII